MDPLDASGSCFVAACTFSTTLSDSSLPVYTPSVLPSSVITNLCPFLEGFLLCSDGFSRFLVHHQASFLMFNAAFHTPRCRRAFGTQTINRYDAMSDSSFFHKLILIFILDR